MFKSNLNEDYSITTDFNKLDINKVCTLLSNTYWANNRPKELIIKSLENSLCFSVFHKDVQIGLLRVITDYVTFAYLCDVIIEDEYRGIGLGKWCLESVLKYKELINVKRWFLITKDAHEFYRPFGFSSLTNPDIYMEINNK